MFLIVVVITRVFCYWILQQLTTHVHLAFPWFGPGLMNSYYNLTAPGDALFMSMLFMRLVRCAVRKNS